MKVLSTKLILLTLPLLTLLSGCGNSGKSTANLEVSNGFLVSASGYDGGLIIVAKKDTGETVSVPLTNSLSTTLELPNGNWTFKAVGWYGYLDTTYKFGGAPYCGSASASLNGSSVSVSLGLSTAKCDSDVFASAQFRNAGTFKDMNSIMAIKTLLKYPVAPTDVVSTKIFSSTLTDAQIISSIPEDLQSSAKAIRIFALKKDLSGVWVDGFASKCLGGGSNGQFVKTANLYNATDFKLPTLMPLAVGIYEDTSCTKEIVHYQFPNGFENAAQDGDHLMQLDPSSNNRLLIIASDHRRGYSPFMALLPTIQCGTTASPTRCKTQPNTVPDFVLYTGSTNERVFIKGHSSCLGITYSSGIAQTSCSVSSDGVNLEVDTIFATVGTSETITAGSTVYNVDFQDPAVSADREKKWAFNDLLTYVGPDSFANFRRTFIDSHQGGDDDENRDAFGLLGKIREHLSPAGAASLFGIPNKADTFRNNCAAVSGTKEISLYNDDGVLETYRVTASPATLTPDTYTCTTVAPDSSACAIAYEKKMQVFNLNVSSTVPEMTFTLDCDKMIGKFSSKEEKTESSGTRKHRDRLIVGWNTETASNNAFQRYEFVKMEENWESNSGTWVKTDEFRSYGRVSKSAQDIGQTMVFSYNTHTDVTNSFRDSVIESRQSSFDTAGSVACVTNHSLASSNLSAVELFDSTTYSSHYAVAYIVNGTQAQKELTIGSTYNGSSYGTVSTGCSSTPYYLQGINSSAFNNHMIFKTIGQDSNALATIDSTFFSSDSYLNH